jgi:hypothetical protein
LEPTL